MRQAPFAATAMKKKHVTSRRIGLACAFFVLAASFAFRQTYGRAGSFANGSFENDYGSWTASGHQVIQVAHPSHAASDGSKVVVFNANNEPGGVLSQTFATTPGQRYGLTFDVGTVGAIADQRMRVTAEGTGFLLDQTLVFAGPTAGPFYIPQHLTFVAESPSTTLTFEDVSFSYFVIDSLLDNVGITPESAQLPLVTSQPQRTAVVQGGGATFIVGASGTGLTYQWQFAGTTIPGATTSSYTVTAADGSKAGNYRVIVTNTAGSVSSSAATLTVLPPAILLNGSFEYGSAAWTFSNSSVSTSTNMSYGVTDGTQLVHFNFAQQQPTGVLSQSFATTAGEAYVLAFDVGATSVLTQNEQRMQVTVQGATSPLLSQSISVFAAKGGAYQPQTFTFVADSSTTTLVFQDTSPTTINVDLLLDHVRVTVAERAVKRTRD